LHRLRKRAIDVTSNRAAVSAKHRVDSLPKLDLACLIGATGVNPKVLQVVLISLFCTGPNLLIPRLTLASAICKLLAYHISVVYFDCHVYMVCKPIDLFRYQSFRLWFYLFYFFYGTFGTHLLSTTEVTSISDLRNTHH
jgi:hypothetical protein